MSICSHTSIYNTKEQPIFFVILYVNMYMKSPMNAYYLYFHDDISVIHLNKTICFWLVSGSVDCKHLNHAKLLFRG